MPAADDAMRLQSSAPSGLRNALLLVFSLVQLRVAVLLLGIIIVLLLAELNSETVNHLHDLARPCLAPQSAMSRRPTGGSMNPLECCQSLLATSHLTPAEIASHCTADIALWTDASAKARRSPPVAGHIARYGCCLPDCVSDQSSPSFGCKPCSKSGKWARF